MSWQGCWQPDWSFGKIQKLHLVEREVPFGENPKNSKKSLYHLSDPYMRFYYRFISPYRSFIELGRRRLVMNVIESQLPAFVGNMWERLCRWAVSGQIIDGITYGLASRWWGGVAKGESMELDVIAESIDRKTLLIGECKWTSAEDAHRLEQDLKARASRLPFFDKYESVRYVLFLKHRPLVCASCQMLFPEDVIGLC